MKAKTAARLGDAMEDAFVAGDGGVGRSNERDQANPIDVVRRETVKVIVNRRHSESISDLEQALYSADWVPRPSHHSASWTMRALPQRIRIKLPAGSVAEARVSRRTVEPI